MYCITLCDNFIILDRVKDFEITTKAEITLFFDNEEFENLLLVYKEHFSNQIRAKLERDLITVSLTIPIDFVDSIKNF